MSSNNNLTSTIKSDIILTSAKEGQEKMILIIDKDKKERETISDIFYYMGIISYPVSPTEAYSELSPVYKAVLISNPENIPDLADYVNRLRGYSRKTPVFSISQNPDDPELNKIFDICF